MSSTHLKVDRQKDVAVVSLERPPVNALNLGLLEELRDTLTELESAQAVRAVVLTGSGACFSAGIDLKEVPRYSLGEQRRMVECINQLLLRLFSCPRPVVAAVNGHANGGALVLALACDYRVGPLGAYKLGLAETRVGVPYPACAMTVVQSQLAPHAARLLVLGAGSLDPETALRLGIVDELAPPVRVLPRALEVAGDLATFPAQSYAHSKRGLRAEALARMHATVSGAHDDLLTQWLTPETLAASQRQLAK